jgi:hypothetical protein
MHIVGKLLITEATVLFERSDKIPNMGRVSNEYYQYHPEKSIVKISNIKVRTTNKF